MDDQELQNAATDLIERNQHDQTAPHLLPENFAKRQIKYEDLQKLIESFQSRPDRKHYHEVGYASI